MFKKGILLWQHKLIWFFNFENSEVLVAISLNRLPVWKYLYGILLLLTVSYFLSEVLRITDNGRNRNLEVFYSFFFHENYRIVKSTENPSKYFCNSLPTIARQRKKMISRTSKTPISSFSEYIFLQKRKKEKHKPSVVNFLEENKPL